MRARHVIAMVAVAAMVVPIGLDVSTAGGAAAAGPRAPRAVYAVAYGPGGSGSTKVGWLPPVSDGGSAITGYIVTPVKAGVPQAPTVVPSTSTSLIFRKLPNGTSYRFGVAATNAVGTGPVVTSSAVAVGAPGQPIIRLVHHTKQALPGVLEIDLRVVNAETWGKVYVVRVDGRCTSSNGGVTKTGYKRQRAGGGDHWVYVHGLTIGKSYRCTVTTTNKYGTSVRSKQSAAVTV